MQKNKIIFLVIVVLLVIASFGVYKSNLIAGVNENGSGWLWGGTQDDNGDQTGPGWISMNSTNDSATNNYGVNIPVYDGQLSGYAWSENLGWIDFGGTSIAYDPTTKVGALSGIASIVGIRDENAKNNSGGWTGDIQMANTNPDSFQCSLTDTSYADQASCDAACIETANCNQFEIIGSTLTTIQDISVVGNTISFDTSPGGIRTISLSNGWPISGNGQARFSGGQRFVEASGSKVFFSDDTRRSPSFNPAYTIDFGENVFSTSGTNPTQFKTLVGSGNTLVFGDSDPTKPKLTLTFSNDICPLAGNLTCSNSPSTCSRPITCTQNSVNHGVSVNPDGTMFGYAWSGELGWIDFSKMTVAVPTACVSDGNYAYSCGVSSSCGACGAMPAINTWYCIKTDNCGPAFASQADCVANGKTCSDVTCPACVKRSLNWREVSPN